MHFHSEKNIVTLVNALTAPYLNTTPHEAWSELLPLPTQPVHRIFVIIDSMGEVLLQTHGAESYLAKHQITTLDSLNPTATAPCMTSYLTGAYPGTHGLLGWDVYEDTDASIPLNPFLLTRKGQGMPSADPSLAEQVYTTPSLFSRIDGPTSVGILDAFADSPFSRHHYNGDRVLTFPDYTYQSFAATLRTLISTPAPHYSLLYWSHLDTLEHRHGFRSLEVAAHFAELDMVFAELTQNLPDYVEVYVSADHGQVEVPVEERVDITDHPELLACLRKPLSGEPRFPIAHVHPEKKDDFLNYISSHLSSYCTPLPSAQFIAEGGFGPAPHHPLLAERAGDFILHMHRSAILFQRLPGEHPLEGNGQHGGMHILERAIPLCRFTAQS